MSKITSEGEIVMNFGRPISGNIQVRIAKFDIDHPDYCTSVYPCTYTVQFSGNCNEAQNIWNKVIERAFFIENSRFIYKFPWA